jgi:hypothetical protein
MKTLILVTALASAGLAATVADDCSGANCRSSAGRTLEDCVGANCRVGQIRHHCAGSNCRVGEVPPNACQGPNCHI